MHQSYETVSVQVAGSLWVPWSKSFDTSSNFFPNLGTIVSSMQRKTGCGQSLSDIMPGESEAVVFMKDA